MGTPRHPDLPPWLAEAMPFLFPVFFVCLWCAICAGLRAVAGFSRATSRRLAGARVVDGVRFGSATIRGVGFNRCLHIDRLEDGFRFRLSPLFLGGSRFFADADLSGWSRATRWYGTTATAMAAGERVVLRGKAAEFVLRHAAPPRA